MALVANIHKYNTVFTLLSGIQSFVASVCVCVARLAGEYGENNGIQGILRGLKQSRGACVVNDLYM